MGRDEWARDKKSSPSSQPGFDNPPITDFFKGFSNHALGQLKLWLEDELPKPPAAEVSVDTSGWTVAFPTDEPVVFGVLPVQLWIPRKFSNWLVFDPEANLATPSSSATVQIALYRERHDASSVVSTDSITNQSMKISAGAYSSRVSPFHASVYPGVYLVNEDDDPYYDCITFDIENEGTGALGLELSIPIGIERVPGSGVH